MPEGFSTYETWPFECLHCLRVWEEEYLVRRQTDGHGNDVVIWTREGTQVQPPWSGSVCPHCGCGSVTTFPTGYFAHHPTTALGQRPGPTAGPAGPLRPAGEVTSDPPRHRIPPLLPYALVAISLLLFAGMQMYGGSR
ncbi:hypothetical protein Pth03_64090 [Planotetraspora thailandica]|uniref:Uncharacterized protein n=1 Tax=Planotetraspora thailandica TaxID=487172 RepID=A0A8J4DD51_9ACTN|nr:hypothetical protein [Planotetraspora thailandica]GII58020.1 hypothetical protein Pth03_64090 [Planotetraspora thailandica]